MSETATIIPFEPRKEPECSFCKRPKSQVKRLIASQLGKHICDKCVAKCTQLMKDVVE